MKWLTLSLVWLTVAVMLVAIIVGPAPTRAPGVVIGTVPAIESVRAGLPAAAGPPVTIGGQLGGSVSVAGGQAGGGTGAAGRAAAAAGSKLSVIGEPTVDVATIRRVLQAYGSPAVDDAEAIYEFGQRYAIDPAICLAFFIVESSAGTKGMATETLSVGNIRATPGYVNHKGYRKYASWREGIQDWYRLISSLYIGEWKHDTVEAIVPVYAPAADNNDPGRYVATVRRLVHQWRSGQVA